VMSAGAQPIAPAERLLDIAGLVIAQPDTDKTASAASNRI
jgi:hypothetical protein